MNILYLSQKSPYPPRDGGAIGTNNVLMGLAKQGHTLKLIAINTPKHSVDVKDIPQEYLDKTALSFVNVNTNVRPLQAFANLFSKRSYNIRRFYDAAFEAEIVDQLKSSTYDIVIFDSIFMKDYLPVVRQHARAKAVLRSPNVEHRIWDRMAECSKNPIKKPYLRMLARRLRQEELESCKDFDAMLTVTEVDKQYFVEQGFYKPISVIPTGIDMLKKEHEVAQQSQALDCFHIGAMDWMPNIEAVDFLLLDIWPKVQQVFPDMQLFLAGRNTPEELLQLQTKNVHVLGEVEDAADFIAEHKIMLVPLISGSGQRVKIIEGMMMGKVVISTRIGLEGIDVKDRENVMIADTADEFVAALQELHDKPELYQEISQAAISFADTYYNNDTIADNLEAFLMSCIA